MADSDKFKVRSGPNGPLYFPKDMPDAKIDGIMKDQADVIKNLPPLEAPGQDRTAGKIPPVEPTSQMPPGWPRTVTMGAGQFARGMIEPIAIPGDVVNIGRQLAAIPPSMMPQTRVLPTTQDLDKWFGPLTPPELTPQGFGEREFAGAARGAGEAASFFAPGAAGRGVSLVTGRPNLLSRYGNLPTNLLTGTASGAASTAAEQEMQGFGQDPTKSSSLGPGVPVAAGALAGLATGSTVQGVTGAYRSLTGTTPYHSVVNALGGNLRTGEPFIEDAGTTLQDAIKKQGPIATNLNQKTYNSLTGKKTDGTAVYNKVIGDPKAAMVLRDEFPDEMDNLAGAHLANRGSWNLHPRVQESLIPDPTQRGIVDQSFRGGIIPGGFTGTMQDIEQRILRGVRSEAAGTIGGTVGELSRSDPSLRASLQLIGAIAPYAIPAVRSIVTSPTGRQGLIGGAVGLGPGTELIPPSMQYNTSSDSTPPQ